MTQSALSRQIQTLEEQLGAPLFERRHRELRLTDAGQILQASAKVVLEEIAQAVARSAASRPSQPLTVSTNQPFASLWLIPRVSRFRALHPSRRRIHFRRQSHRRPGARTASISPCAIAREAMAPGGCAAAVRRAAAAGVQPGAGGRSRRGPLRKPEDLAASRAAPLFDEARTLSLAQLVGVARGRRAARSEAGRVDALQSLRPGDAGGARRSGRGAGTRAADRQPAQASAGWWRRCAASTRRRGRTTSVDERAGATCGRRRNAFVDWLLEEAAAEVDSAATSDPGGAGVATRRRVQCMIARRIGVEAPSPWVVRFAPLVRARRRVLDVACGQRPAQLVLCRARLPRRSPSIATRRRSSALAGAAGVTRGAAPTSRPAPWPLAGQRFDAVVVTRLPASAAIAATRRLRRRRRRAALRDLRPRQ